MKSLLENVKDLDELIRHLQVMESRMRSGQFIDAWRENCRLIANLSKHRQDLLANNIVEKKDVK